MKEVFSSSSTCVPTPCQLMLEWTGKGKPKPVSQKIVLEGSEGHKWFRIHYPPPSSEGKNQSILHKPLEICSEFGVVVYKNSSAR